LRVVVTESAFQRVLGRLRLLEDVEDKPVPQAYRVDEVAPVGVEDLSGRHAPDNPALDALLVLIDFHDPVEHRKLVLFDHGHELRPDRHHDHLPLLDLQREFEDTVSQGFAPIPLR
jgi:hypothetical protein